MRIAAVAIVSVSVFAFLALPADAQTKSESDSVLTMRGLGPVRLGMTVREASAAGHVLLTKRSQDAADGSCKFVLFGTDDAFFYVGAKDGRLHGACATSKRVSTANGIRLGDSQKKLAQFPSTSLKQFANHYELKATNPQDRGYVIWFVVLGDHRPQGGEITEICAAPPALHAHLLEGGC